MIAILLLLPLHCIVVFQHHSSSGALSASTQKPPQGGILPMILMSVPSNSKSKTFAFSMIRFSLEDLGSGTMFFCNSQRRHTWLCFCGTSLQFPTTVGCSELARSPMAPMLQRRYHVFGKIPRSGQS